MTTDSSPRTIDTTLPTAPARDDPAPATPAVASPAPERKPVDKRVAALLRFAASITAFTILGYAFLGFEQAPITPIVCVLAGYAIAIAVEALDAWAHHRRPEFAGGPRALGVFLLPPHITALSCTILLYGNNVLWPYLFAVTVGITSKYVFRFSVAGRSRHFLNPSNTGIALTLVLFPWVGIAPPYHFTNWLHGTLSWLVPLGILMAGSMLNAKLTGKMPLILAWVAGFVAQAVLRWAVLDYSLIAGLLPMTGVAFVLYTNYMITDPGSTPSRRRGQIVFGLTTALLYGILVVSGVVFGLFFALVFTCVLRGVVLYVSPRMTAWRRARAEAVLDPAADPAPDPVTRPAAPVGDGS